MDGLIYRLGLLHSPFDKALLSAAEGLRANGKVLFLMAVHSSGRNAVVAIIEATGARQPWLSSKLRRVDRHRSQSQITQTGVIVGSAAQWPME